MLIDIFSGHALPGEYVFLLLCMGAAWMTGRSLASDWKPVFELVIAALALGLAARFLHYALYEAQFVSLRHYVGDTLVLGLVAWLGYRATRTNQMTRQYYWLYEKASPFTWKDKKTT